jgi:hypothetical protein
MMQQTLNSAELDHTLTDKQYIESLFEIVDKKSEKVPFIYNPIQKRIDKSLKVDPNRKIINIIIKARKQGVSSLILGKFSARGLRFQYRRAVTVSHEGEATQRLFQRARFYIDNLPHKPNLGTESKKELNYSDTQSTHYIGTAGAKSFGRGDDITELHVSELDWWENPDMLTGLIEACLPGALIIIETTGNGYGSKTHQMVMKALKGEADYNVIFIPWFESPEYSIEAPGDFEPSVSELNLMDKFNININQIYWRRCKIRDMDAPELFPQEYPATIEEAFLTDQSPLVVLPMSLVQKAIESDNRRGNKRIMIACDVAGEGDDETVIYVIDRYMIQKEKTVILKSCDPYEISARIKLMFDEERAGLVVVDVIGEGAGVVANLKRMIGEDKVVGIQSASKLDDMEQVEAEEYRFYNVRAQMWWKARKLFRDNRPSIPQDPELITQLTNVRYKIKNGKILIEPKSELKKANRIGKSPDRADCLIYGLFYMDKCPEWTNEDWDSAEEPISAMYEQTNKLQDWETV